MSSEENGRKAKIIVLSIILAIVVIFITVVAIVEIVKLNRKNAPPAPEKEEEQVILEPEEEPEETKINVFSNSYNEAITTKILTDDAYDYKGSYAFYTISTPIFDESVTAEEKQQFWNDNDCRDANDYIEKINNEKLEQLRDATITIDKPINEQTGSNENFGVYTYYLSSRTIVGKVYGDRNLAVLVKDNDETEFYFISLNYKKFNSAVEVSEETYYEAGTIYLFENHYKNGQLFYSLTYTFKAI